MKYLRHEIGIVARATSADRVSRLSPPIIVDTPSAGPGLRARCPRNRGVSIVRMAAPTYGRQGKDSNGSETEKKSTHCHKDGPDGNEVREDAALTLAMALPHN